MIDRNLLIGVAIGIGGVVVYNVISDEIFRRACKDAGGTPVYRCKWWIFCHWACDPPEDDKVIK